MTVHEPLGWYSRGYVPHFDADGIFQHVTFHLADSLPRSAIERMQRQLSDLTDEEKVIAQRQRIQELLDSGLGACVLADEHCADIIEKTLFFGDGERYKLLAWCIMPNHVHVLIQQQDKWPLVKIIQPWKRHSARQINLFLGSPSCTWHNTPTTALWQRDYWDRFIRDENHYRTAKKYIEENPVKAKLVGSADMWRWESAAHGL